MDSNGAERDPGDVSAQILSTPAEGVPEVVADDEGLRLVVAALRAGEGPIAIDAERASGHRYDQRAYLIQLRREGSGTHLIDPVPLGSTQDLAAVLADAEWILHAATQDLPCLRELDLHPRALFDTELAGRLLGLPRVGLAGLSEDVLGVGLAKGHGAADWSRRPLPREWLAYAALDVELLAELREDLIERLRRVNRLEWARQEFDALLTWQPRVHPDPWRRTKGVGKIKDRRDLAVARELWRTRDRIAQRADQPQGRILSDAAIIAAVKAAPADEAALKALPEFARQRRSLSAWWKAVTTARRLPESDLPPSRLPEQIPPHRSWASRRPEAAQMLSRVRAAIAERADELGMAHEVLVPPEAIRVLIWERTDTATGEADVAEHLRASGARPWQIEQVAAVVAAAWTHQE